MSDAAMSTELPSDDPSDAEEDLGTAVPISLADGGSVVTPVTETVFSVLSSAAEGYIIIQPAYQRRAFWDRRKKASLIESVFLGLPLPLFYLADTLTEIDGEVLSVREVVDGQQRLTSLRDFYAGNLLMPEDSIVEDLRNKTFPQLRPGLKQVFKDFKISTATIPVNSKANKFDLFSRLNQRSTVLSAQELRNAAYHGEYLDLIKDQAATLATSLRVTEADFTRMKDVEYLTRLLAFERRGFEAFPNKQLNRFLNDEMIFGEADSARERLRRINRVKKALERVTAVFGELRFRPYRIPDKGFNGEWAATVNRALMEAQVWSMLDHATYGFSDQGSFDVALREHRDDIIEYARRLHAYNDRFNDAIQRGTTGSPNVRWRFSRFQSAVQWALDVVPEGRRKRFFSPQQKINLWDALESDSRVCSECGSPLTFAETEVDHIQPFSEGGETVEANGQLLHIACNRFKGARWDPVDSSEDIDVTT